MGIWFTIALLTLGDWTQTRNFWDGYFNPSFWPALFFRTALCISC